MHPRVVAWLLERLYNECAALYTTVAMCVSHGHWFLWGEAIIPFLQGPILELGCGTGRLQAALAARGICACGIDRSAAMLRRAPAHLPLCRADARAIPAADAAFATVVAVFPTPYIADPHTIGEIDRVLQPAGRLVILLSAGAHDVRSHPLWSAYVQNGWALEQPTLVAAQRALHVVIATRVRPALGVADAADH